MMAEDARGALYHLEQRPPDLLIMDAGVLAASGLGTCKELQGKLETLGLPVILLSTLAGLREQSAARLVDAYMTMSHPTTSEVVAVVEGLLGHVGLSHEAPRLWRTAS